MEKLEIREIESFQSSLKDRIKMTGRTDLFHTVGFLCQMEEIGGEVFVDKKKGDQVSLICVRFGDLKHLIPGHIDKEIPSVECISLHVWCESVEQLNWSNLKEFFDSTLLENFEKPSSTHYSLLAVNDKLLDVLQRSEHFKWKMIGIHKAHLATKMDQTNFPTYPCPDGFHIRPLTHEDTLFVLENYKYGGSPNVRSRLLGLSSIGKCRGVFDIKTGELVSWLFLNWDCSLSAFFTRDNWRRKGLGLAVNSSLIEMCQDKGYPVFVMIVIQAGSERSKHVAGKFGLRSFEGAVVAWCDLHPNYRFPFSSL